MLGETRRPRLMRGLLEFFDLLLRAHTPQIKADLGFIHGAWFVVRDAHFRQLVTVGSNKSTAGKFRKEKVANGKEKFTLHP